MAEDATLYVRASDAARAIGVSVSRMHDVIHAGECAHRTRRIGTPGQLFEIACSEVERIHTVVPNGFLTLRPASWQVSHPRYLSA